MGHQLKHGSNHIDGSDQIPDATPSTPGLMTAQHVVDLANAATTSWLRPVLSSLDTPPVTPNEGDRHRIIATAVGVWIGLEDQIAEWISGAWEYTIPDAGDVVVDIAADDILRYSGSAWLDAGYDAAEIKTLYESNADTNAFTDAEQTKVGHLTVTQAVDLDTIETDVGLNNTHRASDGTDHANVVLNDSHRTGNGADHADVASNTAAIAAAVAVTDGGAPNAGKLVELDGGGLLDGRDVGADGTKLDFITVTQAVDLDTIESDVATNNAKVTNATHTGDVTGDTALTIAADAVTYDKIQNVVADNVLLGNNAGAGSPVAELAAASVRTILNVADGADVTADNPPQAHALAGALHTVPAPTTVTPDATPGTTDIDWSNGPIQLLDLVNATGTETLTFSNMLQGHTYRLFLKQHPTTPQNVTLPANALVVGGTAPTTLTLSAGAAAIDELVLFYDGTNVYVEDFRQNYG